MSSGYEVCIDLKKGSGAIYSFRERGAASWISLYNINDGTLSSFRVGADVYSGRFSIDNLKIVSRGLGPTVTHAYGALGDYTVTLRVVDDNTPSRMDTGNNDNLLEITDEGIIHSSGDSMSFIRDEQGRITTITDPLGNVTTFTPIVMICKGGE